MKKLLVFALAAFFVLSLLFLPKSAEAQFYADMTKDYCSSVYPVSADYDKNGNRGGVSIKTNINSQTKNFVVELTKITVVEKTNNTTRDFSLNNSLPFTSLVAGRLIALPQAALDFISNVTSNRTSASDFDIQMTKTVKYEGPMQYKNNDPSQGPIIISPASCQFSSAQPLRVQAQQQQQPQPPASPAGGGNIGPPGPGAPRRGQGPEYCDPPANTRISTAIGCIPVNDPHAFAGWFLGWAIGISGGLALLFIIFSGYQIMTAAGDPQRLQSGRELLTAAVSGLILIIFSIFLLRLIGVQILHIPGII